MVVDLTKTAQTGDMYYSWPQRMILPGYNPTTKAHGRVLSDAAKLFSQSYRPVLYVGGGAARSNAGAQVKALADLTGAPVVTTLPGTRHHSRLRPEEPRHARHARYDCRNRRRAAR